MLKKLFQFFASLKLAVILLFVFAVLLSWATVYESKTSMEEAQRLVYKTLWFDFYLLLVGLNVLCATLIRYPWKKKQIGFVITHVGILVILFGSMITREYGIEGQLIMQEGETQSELLVNEPVLSIASSKLNLQDDFIPRFMDYPIPVGSEILFELEGSGVQCYIEQYFNNPHTRRHVLNDNPHPNPAIAVNLHQHGRSGSLDEWLFANSPSDSMITLPQAEVLFKQISSAIDLVQALTPPSTDAPIDAPAVLQIKNASQVVVHQLEVSGAKAVEEAIFELNGTEFIVSIQAYMKRAKIVDGKLADVEDGSINPAVQFEIMSASGKEAHVAFAAFPKMGSSHGNVTDSQLTGVLVVPPSESNQANQVVIYAEPSGKLHYRATNTSGDFKTGEVTIGQEFDSTWGGILVRVDAFQPNARMVNETVEGAPGSANHQPMAKARVEYNGESKRVNLMFNQSRMVTLGGDTIEVLFGSKRHPLGFAIQLLDFSAPRYPGTNRPSRFQSQVKLIDAANGIEREQLIYMNNPLEHNNFKIYQSGYNEGRNGEPDVSIFSAALAPGTPVIYVGSIIMVFGMILLYYNKRKSNTILTTKS